MVNTENGHCRIYRAITEGNAACGRTDCRGEMGRALRCHHVAGFNCNHVSIRGLVRTGTGADVDDRASVGESRMDPCTEMGILAPGVGIAVSNGVVASHKSSTLGLTG